MGISTEDSARYRKAFVFWLRTGRWLVADRDVQYKFNPWHDPQNGQFTSAGAGSYSGDGGVGGGSDGAPRLSDGVYRPAESSAQVQPAQYRPPPRGGGSNSAAFQDPMTLERAFPGLQNAPGGSIIALADNFLDITGPMREMTTEMSRDYSNNLISEIISIDPAYRFDSLGFPTTLEGQMNQIIGLRFDRAAALFRVRGVVADMQVETLRFMQKRTDEAYEEGMKLLREGRLSPRLSPEEALGNYIDREVRDSLRYRLNMAGIDESRSSVVRVNRNENDTSSDERTFRRPDARVDDIAYDTTLTLKTLSMQQVRGFFSSDFRPKHVIIIRPSQFGPGSSYIIVNPGAKK